MEIAGPLGDALGVALDTALFGIDEDVNAITLGNDRAFTATDLVEIDRAGEFMSLYLDRTPLP